MTASGSSPARAASSSEKPRRRSQAERAATAHRKMIRAATRLIGRQGYTKTTLAQVGKEAGYSGGLVSHHFGSKEGLLMETVQHLSHRFRQDQIEPAVEGLSGLESLAAFVDLYLDELVLRPGRMRALYVVMGEAIGPVAEIRPVIAELNRGLWAGIATLIERGVAEGEIRSDVDPQAQAVVIVGMLRGVTSQAFTDEKAFDLETVRRAMQRTLRETLGKL